MACPPPGLYDSFTERGLFWLAGKHKDEVPGTLAYDPENGAVLTLLGMFGKVHESFRRALGGSREGEAVIHGVTMKGKPVSLLHALDTKHQFHMPGIASETWTSNLMVIGAHITSSEEPIFPKCYFRFDEIETWLKHSPFTATHDTEAKTLNVLAEKPRETPFASHAEFNVSTVGSLFSDNKPDTRFVIDVISQIAITPPEPRSLDWHLDRAARLQELASLCTGHYLPLTSFELRGPNVELGGGGTVPSEVHLYSRLIHGESGLARTTKRRTPIITGPELIRFNPQAVQHWFDQFEAFDPALRLFFTITAQRQMFTNIQLLLAIQALEVFHRRTGGDTVMPEADFASFADDMTAAIPASANPDMREKLESLYRFANEPSLKQRLRAIIASLTQAFGEAPGGFNGKFLRKLVDTRNYYTHFSEELSERTFDGEGMYWATRRVILLLTLLFLQRIGLAAADIKPLLERHREFAQLWAKADRPR
ncbi:hypothetical protein M2336_001052 [Sphingobium sp. B1D7B]|uniref:ApeA N-terminal domain 1-containing protein n=1 Tax=Sphingobium sp. B1D7B TaxID=2940578 RepID=UPI0022244BA5|nr:HEPN domain-containing protein [Sphingobium sp. B1D7B]MCW2404423.1 hypothetical protein [Sphingobium sp. B1D7B]